MLPTLIQRLAAVFALFTPAPDAVFVGVAEGDDYDQDEDYGPK